MFLFTTCQHQLLGVDFIVFSCPRAWQILPVDVTPGILEQKAQLGSPMISSPEEAYAWICYRYHLNWPLAFYYYFLTGFTETCSSWSFKFWGTNCLPVNQPPPSLFSSLQLDLGQCIFFIREEPRTNSELFQKLCLFCILYLHNFVLI